MYKLEITHIALCKLISRFDLLVCIDEIDALEEYIRKAYNSRFSYVSMQTTTRNIINYFDECCGQIVECLGYCVSCVVVASDIWSRNAKGITLVWLFIMLMLIGP